jgi:hypothetical protein
VVFLAVVVVVDEDVVDDRPEFLSFDFVLEVVAVLALVDVAGGSGAGGAVAVVAGGVAAASAVGSTRLPAAAPGRGSEPAGDAWAGGDVAGRAGAASDWGDGGGFAVSGAGITVSASSLSGAFGSDRAT